MTLTEFLLARLDEDEMVAQAATQLPWVTKPGQAVRTETGYKVAARVEKPANRGHIARHDPARVLVEVAAKRAIVQRSIDATGATVADDWPLYFLALPYADHPDYDESWRP